MKDQQTPTPVPVYNVPFKITILVNGKPFHTINTVAAVDAKDKETAIQKAEEAASNLTAKAITYTPEKVGLRYLVQDAPKVTFMHHTYPDKSIKAVAIIGTTIRIDFEHHGTIDNDTFALWGENKLKCEDAFNDLLKQLNIKK